MPYSAPSIRSCGCVVPYGARCDHMQAADAARKARFDRKRPNSSQRGYDREWEREAKAFLALPEHQRCECGAKATLVRHKRSIRIAPHLRMEWANWKPGCQRCNALDAAKERRILKGNEHV